MFLQFCFFMFQSEVPIKISLFWKIKLWCQFNVDLFFNVDSFQVILLPKLIIFRYLSSLDEKIR